MKKKNLLMTVVAIFGLASITIAQTVPSYVPTNGLVGWWPFNGNANDESGNGNNGTVNGATLTTDRFGIANKAYSFNGVDDYILTQNSGPVGNSSRSISLWMKTTSSNTSQLIGYGIQPPSGGEFNLLINQLCQGITIDVHNNYITYNSISLNDGNWHNISCIYDNSLSINITGVSIFVDGILTISSNCQNPINVNVNTLNGVINMGRYQSGQSYFNGKLDDIGIWDRALTECEIKDLYNAQLNSSASIQAGTDVSICEGNDVIFNGSGGSNFTWNNGVQNGVAYTPTISQEYIVIGQDADNCYGTDTIYVELIPNTTANQTETALDSYTWPINNQTYNQSGTYTAVIPNAAGCDSTITLDLSLDFTGINEFSEDNLFTVFPNPAQSVINVKSDSKLIGFDYSIYDNMGRIVLTGKLSSENTTIELGNLSGGIYMLSIGENLKQTFKVIKE